jgi:hypothetical protein
MNLSFLNFTLVDVPDTTNRTLKLSVTYTLTKVVPQLHEGAIYPALTFDGTVYHDVCVVSPSPTGVYDWVCSYSHTAPIEPPEPELDPVSNVVSLVKNAVPKIDALSPDDELVRVLQDLLDRALTGELRSSVGAACTNTGDVISWIAGSKHQPFVMTGALAKIQHRYMENHID